MTLFIGLLRLSRWNAAGRGLGQFLLGFLGFSQSFCEGVHETSRCGSSRRWALGTFLGSLVRGFHACPWGQGG
ncbi:hypothetical protein, partial [Desulfosoma sp.]